MALSQSQQAALAAFVIAALFGALAQRARFCGVGALSDWLHFGDTARLRAWLLAIGVAILGLQALRLVGSLELDDSAYLGARIAWLAHLLGGVLFGVGMTLASGCVQRNLVLAGGGNLKSVVVLAALAAGAYLAQHGPLAAAARALSGASIDLATYGLSSQSLAHALGRALAGEAANAGAALLALAAGLVLVAIVLADRRLRERREHLAAGLALGLLVVAGWYLTGVVGAGVEGGANSLNFMAPLLAGPRRLPSAALLAFAAMPGLLVGSFVYALAARRFHFERFASRGDLLAHAGGGALMGVGGVLALGGTIGQGVTGASTLAAGSLLTLGAIVLGAVATMKVQYHLLDDVGFARALVRALAELRPQRRRAKAV